MKNFDNINVTSQLRRCFEKATMISDMFDDEYIRTAYVMMAVFFEPESLVNKGMAERGIYAVPNLIIESLLNDEATFSTVFGKKAAQKYFSAETDENKQVETKQEALEETKKSVDLKEVLMEALSDMFAQDIEYGPNLEIRYSDKLEDICEEAATRCFLAKQDYLDLDNLTYTILQNENSSGYKVLKILLDSVKEGYSMDIEIEDIINFIELNGNIHTGVTSSTDEKKTLIIPKNLESCCTVINNKFKPGVKSDILGRDKELFKLWNIFSKRTKRNAILLGEAGVGKTAIVEALVQDIVNGTCPERFKDYIVLELDVGGTVAGTKYRGELEEKLNKLKKFLENTPNLILFIDEIHQLVGAGSSESSGFDMSGALKPILARGDIVCVGATTIAEYERFIAKEQAFKRRFEPVIVKEPKHSEVAEMIKAKVESLSEFHNVTLEDGVLDYIIVCASAFNLTGTNPDKSIDLCDRSMAIAEMRNSKVVQKQDVDKVYEENYKKFEKCPDEMKESTAYHEAGHYVMSRITSLKDEEDVIAVSIVPGPGFVGAYIYDINKNVVAPTYKYYLDDIKVLLAGRIAQDVFCGYNDAGAYNDLQKAVAIAKEMVTAYSLVPGLGYANVCLEGAKDLYNERVKGTLLERVNEIIKNATIETENMLKTENIKRKVENVAKLLLEKKIATAKELEDTFNKE